jgi:hypothetical protein
MQLVKHALPAVSHSASLHFGRDADPDDNALPGMGPYRRAASSEELPYMVEVWNDKGTTVEQTLAITANASIGYAAYYEATKEFPSRYVTLRHKNRIVARWNLSKQ